jgi:archaellum component FlaC
MTQEIKPFKLIGHNRQIADTGDYDGCYEITNGKISIFTKDDNDEGLEKLIASFNETESDFYLDDSWHWEIENFKFQLAEKDKEIARLKDEIEKLKSCN